MGGVWSEVQLNSSAARLSFPALSIYEAAGTLIVTSPSAPGVSVAVYVVPLPENTLRDPLVTTTSPEPKLAVVSELVKVRERVGSLLVSPSLTSAAVITMVGGVESIEIVNEGLASDSSCQCPFSTLAVITCVPPLNAAEVRITVVSLVVPAAALVAIKVLPS